ncbi:MAG: prepilin-type N-terminal cleavage/methylation domain-containing protein [Planctomycetes bacterium]|nr:prepilin-type N-terminal cleavage/methylation domain-containing protein [Planctomycetota bacterium]
MNTSVKREQRGFTLVELAVVVVILGVLAAFGVPRFMASVERSKASEAYTYLSTVQTAQERYLARQGSYASKIEDLDIGMDAPEYFTVSKVTVPAGAKSLETGWTVTLTRTGAAAGYGTYTVTYNQLGYDSKKSTIPDEINPRQT